MTAPPEHQPDYNRLVAFTRPGGGPADAPAVVTAPCTCGEPAHVWEAKVFPPSFRPNRPAIDYDGPSGLPPRVPTAAQLAKIRAEDDPVIRRILEDALGARTCAWCHHVAPAGGMEPISAGPSVACRDTGACQGRITAAAAVQAARLDTIN